MECAQIAYGMEFETYSVQRNQNACRKWNFAISKFIRNARAQTAQIHAKHRSQTHLILVHTFVCFLMPTQSRSHSCMRAHNAQFLTSSIDVSCAVHSYIHIVQLK